MKNVIGILGGMGPQATVDAMNKLIQNTKVSRDQEHIPVIAISIPDIPDRTFAINNNSDEPFYKMAEYLHFFEKMNVGCIIIPCNTAHFWFNKLKKNTTLDMLSIIESVTQYAVKAHVRDICILGTSATINTKLYQNQFDLHNIGYAIPSNTIQDKIMTSIYKYKSGDIQESKEIMRDVIKQIELNRSGRFLLACTEIPLILEDEIKKDPSKFIDATDVLINDAIEWYRNCSALTMN